MAVDIYKGLWTTLFGPNSDSAPTLLSALVVNSDGSINVLGTVVVAPAILQLSSAGAGQYNLSVAGVAVALTVPVGAKAAQINVSGADVRYTDDGTTPTAAVGMPASQGASWLYTGPLAALKFIAQSGTATLDVSYYK